MLIRTSPGPDQASSPSDRAGPALVDKVPSLPRSKVAVPLPVAHHDLEHSGARLDELGSSVKRAALENDQLLRVRVKRSHPRVCHRRVGMAAPDSISALFSTLAGETQKPDA